jgi:hypothetical protein
MFDDNNFDDALEMEDCEIKHLQDENSYYIQLLKEVSMCQPVSPEKRMSYVEIQMDWELYDKIHELFP